MDGTLVKTFELSRLLNMDIIKRIKTFKGKFALQAIIKKFDGRIQQYSGSGDYFGLYEFPKAQVIITDIDVPTYMGTQVEGYLDGKYFIPIKIIKLGKYAV
jgi:hypothetical protein